MKPVELSLKNKFCLLFGFSFFVFFLAQCGEPKEKNKNGEVKADPAGCVKKPLNPNGESELALLMRAMRDNAESLKEQIKKGEITDKFPEAFLKIYTATPTDADTKHDSYDAFARNYIYNLQELYKFPKAELTKNYNAVINSCLSCHSDHCPGPVKTIEKLKIAE